MNRRYHGIFLLFSVFLFLLGNSPISSPVFAVGTDPVTESAEIATMPMTSNVADGINNIENVNTNPRFNQVTSTPGDSNVPITSGADSNNQFLNPNNIGTDGGTPTDNNQVINTKPELNVAISPSGNSIVPATSSVDPNRVANPENTGINTGQSLNKVRTLTNNNEPLEESTSLNSITPSSRDANTNQVLDKESLLGSKLQELIQGDQACNRLYDKTIITWKNIVDRTKSIVDNFGLADTKTETETDTETTTNNTVTTFPVPRDADIPRTNGMITSDTLTQTGVDALTQTDIGIMLDTLGITKNTDIDKRDHTTIRGTDDKDYIVGSEEDDLICAKDGNDVIFSDAGVDAIFAQGGMDTVQGGIGNNQIFGGDEGDTLVGGIDDDLIVGRAGDDRLFADEGNDVLEGDKGADYFACGEGIDIVLDFNPKDGDIINDECETS